MILNKETVQAYATVEAFQAGILADKKDIKDSSNSIYRTMAKMLDGAVDNVNVIRIADIDALLGQITISFGVAFGKKSKAAGTLDMEMASQVARDWATVARGCVESGANDLESWIHTPSNMRYIKDLNNTYKVLGKEETDALLAADEAHKEGTAQGIRNSLKKIKDDTVIAALREAGLMAKEAPLPEGMILVSDAEYMLLETIRKYLDGTSETDTSDWLATHTGSIAALMIPTKKKGKKAA